MVSARWTSWEALRQEYRLCSTEQTRSALLLPLCPRTQRWSHTVAAIARGNSGGASARDVPAAGVASQLLRRVQVKGSVSAIGLLRSQAGSSQMRIQFDEPRPDHEAPFGWASLTAFGASDCCSRSVRMVVVTGGQLVEYLQTVFEEDCSNLKVCSDAAAMLMDVLDSMTQGGRELVLFEGVVRQCKRQTRGSHSGSGGSANGFAERLRVLCELTIALLQHRGRDRSFLR